MNDVRQKVFRVPENIVISVGLCWDFMGADPVDLDLSAVCFTKEGQFVDVVFYNHLFPEGTDQQALRDDYLVDPEQLPYMFLSGDSHIGGEEENQLPGLALAARRRKHLLRNDRKQARTAAEAVFNRLYDEDELKRVQDAMDDVHHHGGDIFDENGQLVHRMPHRELCDEVLTFVMQKLPTEAEVIFISVSSFTGQDFTVLPSAKLIIYNETTNERVGAIDLKYSTGNGTANLSCMLMRVSAEVSGAVSSGPSVDGPSGYWDLREVNVRTFGYTFVDVLPLMQDVLGTPSNSRLYALQNMPDFPLAKYRADLAEQPLSDVRFGIGWDGEHDCDAFLVMLDESHNYVDHVYSKCGKLRSATADLARHSGDALNGTNTHGDEEFIDLITYRVPPNVQTIVVGATYMESFGPRKAQFSSIFDVPNFYMRIQNRTLENPYSFELDRWDVSRTPSDQVKRTYRAAADRSVQPVRAVLLGVMRKRGTIPFEALFPNGRRLDQHYRRDASPSRATSVVSGRTVEAGLQEEVPLFDFAAVHQHIPVDPRGSFTSVIPFLQAVATFLGGSGGASALPAAAGGGAFTPSQTQQQRLDRDNNAAGWDHSVAAAVGGRDAQANAYRDVWDSMQKSDGLAERFAIEVTFLEVITLQPQLPDKFRCHGEAWVYGHSPLAGEGDGENRPFRTPYLVQRDNMTWSTKDATGIFLVHKYDRIRVMLYEYAAFGFADIELMHMPELWDFSNPKHKKQTMKTIDIIVTLGGGGHLSQCEVKLRLARTSYSKAQQRLQKAAERDAARKKAHANRRKHTAEEVHNEEYSQPCSLM